MSIESWEDEFYPVSAEFVAEAFKNRPAALLDHSITKWKGLTPENLARHGGAANKKVVRFGRFLVFWVEGTTCSLCQAHHNEDAEEGKECDGCPIMEVTGLTCCVEYEKFLDYKDPQPMIDLLERVRGAYG